MTDDTNLGLFNLFKQSSSNSTPTESTLSKIPDKIQTQGCVGDVPEEKIPDRISMLYSEISKIMSKNRP